MQWGSYLKMSNLSSIGGDSRVIIINLVDIPYIIVDGNSKIIYINIYDTQTTHPRNSYK